VRNLPERQVSVCALSNVASRHPYNLMTALLSFCMLQIANRRLFSVVREERKLTYDASFQLHNREVYRGSWYTVSVTSSPQQVQAALQACKEALASLKGSFGVAGDAVQSAKRTLVNKFHSESATNKFWAENLCGTLSEAVPEKSLRCIADYESVLATVGAQDIQALVEAMGFEEEHMTACVGTTAPEPPK
jgi:predicted Zn-dependent peptidase